MRAAAAPNLHGGRGMEVLAPALMRASAGQDAPGILYIEDFDAPTVPDRPSSVPAIITPSFTAEDLDAAREEGRRAGAADATTERAGIDAQLRTAALGTIGEALGAARADARSVAQAMAEETAAAILALLAAALPAAAARTAGGEVAALLQTLLPALSREPTLNIRVHPELLNDISAAIEPIWPPDGGRLTLTGDATLAPADVRVSWNDGDAVRDTAALWADISAALAPYNLPDVDRILKGGANGN